MKVEFLSRFSKDLDRITDPAVKADIKATIEQVKTAPTQKSITNQKKLQGYKTAHRIRIGNYRIGVFIEKGTVQFTRVVDRKDIYKVFP